MASTEELLKAVTDASAEKDEQIKALQAKLPDQEDLSHITAGTYVSTKRYLSLLEQKNLSVNTILPPEEENGKERVIVDLKTTSENGDSFTYSLTAIFNSSNDRVQFYIWNLINYDAADRGAVQEICGSLNSSWQWLKFYVDDSDNSVTANYTLPLAEDAPMTSLMWDAVLQIDDVLGYAYDDLLPYQVK